MEGLKADLDGIPNDDKCCGQCLDEEEANFLLNVEELDGGRWKTCFHTDSVFFPLIIGSKGSTKERIQIETGTDISVPGRGETGDIVITGDDKFSVARARKQIKLLQKNRGPFTHFISVPVNDETFQQGFLIFKDNVLKNCHERGIHESLFQSVHRLHLTIALLVLCDDADKIEASRMLDECNLTVINPLLSNKSLLLEMTGIDYMKNNPSKVSVLYGKVLFPENPHLLQELADSIVTFFSDKGIIKKKRAHVKLHCTLMNTSFLRGKPFDGVKKCWSFDATAIMKNFADFHFGKALIDRIDISLMPSLMRSSDKSAYYQAASSISLASMK